MQVKVQPMCMASASEFALPLGGSLSNAHIQWRSVGGAWGAYPLLGPGVYRTPRAPPVKKKCLPHGPPLKQFWPPFFCHPVPLHTFLLL